MQLNPVQTNELSTANPAISRVRVAFSVALGALLSAGCAGPIADPSPIMQKSAATFGAPPAEKSLVLIHRPRAYQGYGLYTGVWDSTHFLADLGNGHSFAYTCEPGKHYFINRSVERVGVVEAQLLPGKIYDLRLDTAGTFIASFQLEPVKRGHKTWEKTGDWSKEHLWVTRAPAAAEHEQERRSDVELIIKDFVHGEKKDRLRQLGPDEHR
jgi:hypothetical protein